MKTYISLSLRDLQTFAEGAGGGAPAGGAEGSVTGGEGATGVTATVAASQRKGAKTNPLADVQYGVQQEETTPAAEGKAEQTTVAQPDRKAEFSRLIKGEYKDLYDANVQEIVQNRLKGSKDIVEKYTALTPMLELLAQKYGVAADDAQALVKAIEEDDSYFEDEALEKGVSVEELKRIRKIERENADLKAQMQEKNERENRARIYTEWMKQAEGTKQVYPSFDLEAELRNPKFMSLLRSNVDVKTAFEVLHKDEIIPAAMQYTAQQVEQKLANKIAANGARPPENGRGSQGAAVVKRDPTQLTKADRAEVARRVARGERVSFS